MRAVVPGFDQWDGPISGLESTGLGAAVAGPTAVGTRLRSFGGAGLAGGGLFAESSGYAPTGLMGDPFDGSEVEIGGWAVDSEEVAPQRGEEFLKSGVLERIVIRGANHANPP